MQKIAKIFARNFVHVSIARPLFWIILFTSYISMIKTEFLQIFARCGRGKKEYKNRQNTHSSNILQLKHIL